MLRNRSRERGAVLTPHQKGRGGRDFGNRRPRGWCCQQIGHGTHMLTAHNIFPPHAPKPVAGKRSCPHAAPERKRWKGLREQAAPRVVLSADRARDTYANSAQHLPPSCSETGRGKEELSSRRTRKEKRGGTLRPAGPAGGVVRSSDPMDVYLVSSFRARAIYRQHSSKLS